MILLHGFYENYVLSLEMPISSELQTALGQAYSLPIKVLGPNAVGGMPEVEETGSTLSQMPCSKHMD